MDLATWLRGWLARHPLKEPTDLDRAQYTAEVMARVRSLARPVTAPTPASRRTWWLRPVLVTVTAAAAVVLVVRMLDQAPQHVAREDQQIPWLSEEGRVPLVAKPAQGAEEIAGDAAGVNELMLAEEHSEDAVWLEETLKLLEEFDEELPEDSFDEGSDNDWLDELEMLDEDALLTSS